MAELVFIKTRWLAFIIHLSISCIILALLAAVVFIWWFPGALFSISGGMDGVQIVILVDLILGPLLTLLVFNVAKPKSELVRDLSVIGLIQLSCLMAGVWVVYQSRPVLLVHVYDTFYSYKMKDVLDSGIDKEQLNSLDGNYPKVVYVEVPKNPLQFLNLQLTAMFYEQSSISLQPSMYKAFPKDESWLQEILIGAEKDANNQCFRLKVQSVYNQGYTCFRSSDLSFVSFEKASLSQLDSFSS